MEIIYNNKKEELLRYYSESDKRLNERLKFIKILENDKLEWKEAHKLSKIWYNIKYNKCKYQPILYQQYLKYNKIYEKLIK